MRVLLSILLLMTVACGALGAAEEEANGDLERILAKPEYTRWRNTLNDGSEAAPDTGAATPTWLDGLLLRLERWLSEWIKGRKKEPEKVDPSSWEYTSGGAWSSRLFTLLGYVLLAVAAVFLVIALGAYIRDRLRNAGKKPVAAAPVSIAKALEDGDALAYDKAEWSKQADFMLGEGDIRLAFRSLYLGLLSGLHEQGRIVFAQTRTNWHYVRSFRGAGEARRVFAEMTDVFDRVWYGLLPAVDEDGLQAMRGKVGALLAEGEKHA